MSSKKYVDHLCERETGIRYVFIISLLSILLLMGSLTVVTPGTETYYIAVIQVITFGFLIVFSFGVMVYCHRREKQREL
jgi:hypothetical protein